MGRRVDSICQHKALLDFVNFTNYSFNRRWLVDEFKDIAPPAEMRLTLWRLRILELIFCCLSQKLIF